MIEIANKSYLQNNIANIRKMDPRVAKVGSQRIYASSTGLDYGGVLAGGKHIEFEVKETRNKNGLPTDNIRMTQLDRMDRISKFGSDTFMIVYFSSFGSWYRINHEELTKVIERSNIPIDYFKAFGYIVPFDHFPDYLNPEAHVDRNELINKFPTWMPLEKTINKTIDIIPKTIDRKQSTLNALIRGCANAERKSKIRKW